jgi:hypothetical protein
MLVWDFPSCLPALSPQTIGFLRQLVAKVANQFLLRCRAMYRIAILPRERDRFVRRVDSALEAVKGMALNAMDGWSLRREDVNDAFEVMVSVHEQTKTYYDHVLRNISMRCMSAGAAFSIVVTNGAAAWAFGSGSDGQIGQGTKVRGCAARACAWVTAVWLMVVHLARGFRNPTWVRGWCSSHVRSTRRSCRTRTASTRTRRRCMRAAPWA